MVQPEMGARNGDKKRQGKDVVKLWIILDEKNGNNSIQTRCDDRV